MKGDLILDGKIHKNVHVIHMGETENLIIYEEGKRKQIIETSSLIDGKVYVDEENLEISGYQYTGTEKGYPEDHPLHGENFRYIKALFFPATNSKNKPEVKEPVFLYKIQGRQVSA